MELALLMEIHESTFGHNLGCGLQENLGSGQYMYVLVVVHIGQLLCLLVVTTSVSLVVQDRSVPARSTCTDCLWDGEQCGAIASSPGSLHS